VAGAACPAVSPWQQLKTKTAFHGNVDSFSLFKDIERVSMILISNHCTVDTI
jgi:hypothetical protein